MIKQSLVALLLVSLFPIAAQAQSSSSITHREWELSIFGGGSYLSDRVYATPVTGGTQPTSRNVGMSYATGSQLGLRVAENRWKHWGAVMEYSFSNQPLRFTNLTEVAPLPSLGHSVHRFSYNVAYYPLDRNHRLRPYAFAGPGVSLFYLKRASKDYAAANGVRLNDPWKFSMNWGGGAKYIISDRVGVSFQFSDSVSDVPHYGLPPNGRMSSGVYSPGFLPSGSLHNRLISLGLIYQWGSR